MNTSTLRKAIKEANRFLELAAQLEREYIVQEKRSEGWAYASPKTTGAVRRASMELTRALAEMRRPS